MCGNMRGVLPPPAPHTLASARTMRKLCLGGAVIIPDSDHVGRGNQSVLARKKPDCVGSNSGATEASLTSSPACGTAIRLKMILNRGERATP